MESKHADDPVELKAADTITTWAAELDTMSSTQASTAEINQLQVAHMGDLLTEYKRLKAEQATYISKHSQASAAAATANSKYDACQKKLKSLEKDLRSAQSELAKQEVKQKMASAAVVDLTTKPQTSKRSVRAATVPATGSDSQTSESSVVIHTSRGQWLGNPPWSKLLACMHSLGILKLKAGAGPGHIRAYKISLLNKHDRWRVVLKAPDTSSEVLKRWGMLSPAQQQKTIIRDITADKLQVSADSSTDAHEQQQQQRDRHRQNKHRDNRVDSDREKYNNSASRFEPHHKPSQRQQQAERHQLQPAEASPLYAGTHAQQTHPMAFPFAQTPFIPQLQPSMPFCAYPTPWMPAGVPSMMMQVPHGAPGSMQPTYSLAVNPFMSMQMPLSPYQQQPPPQHPFGMRF